LLKRKRRERREKRERRERSERSERRERRGVRGARDGSGKRRERQKRGYFCDLGLRHFQKLPPRLASDLIIWCQVRVIALIVRIHLPFLLIGVRLDVILRYEKLLACSVCYVVITVL
jgi:hypothetical protein